MIKIKKKYFEEGFLHLKKVFSLKELNNLKLCMWKVADKDFSQMLNLHNYEYLLSQYIKKIYKNEENIKVYFLLKEIKKYSEYFLSIYKKEKLVRIFNNLYNKEVVGLQTQAIYKFPQSKYGKQSYVPHQDNSYAKNKKGLFFTAHIFLVNSDKKNGTLYVYKGSHKMGLKKFTKRSSFKNHLEAGNLISIKNLEEKFQKIDINANPGDVLIMHGNLVHGSYVNLSKKPRPTFSLCAIPKNERFSKGYYAQREIFSLR